MTAILAKEMGGMSYSVSPLVDYTIRGLDRLFISDVGLWSYSYRFDRPENPLVSIPEKDVFYSLNVLLGFSKVLEPRSTTNKDLPGICANACQELRIGKHRPYIWGMALWAVAELGYCAPRAMLDDAHTLAVCDERVLARWSAQDVGMMLSGLVAMARREESWLPAADRLYKVVAGHLYEPQSALFYNSAKSPRRNFASFASQVYCTLGLYAYGGLTGDAAACEIADSCVRKLISLQGPRGEWPWFYSVAQGTVVDFYEVYSVHQHGMAPAFLHHAVARQIPGAREALVKGFNWIFGDNEMGRTLLRPELHLIHRSVRRAGWRGTQIARVPRSILRSLTTTCDRIENKGGVGLEFTQEVRSYELGWLLWSFADRTDYPELTERSEFRPMSPRLPLPLAAMEK